MIRKAIIVVLMVSAIGITMLCIHTWQQLYYLFPVLYYSRGEESNKIYYSLFGTDWMISSTTKRIYHDKRINQQWGVDPHVPTHLFFGQGVAGMYVKRSLLAQYDVREAEGKVSLKKIRIYSWGVDCHFLVFMMGVMKSLIANEYDQYMGFQISLWVVVVLLAAYPTIAFIRGPLRRWRRYGQGMCQKCGYNLTGNVSGVCPECGTEIQA